MCARLAPASEMDLQYGQTNRSSNQDQTLLFAYGDKGGEPRTYKLVLEVWNQQY